MKGSHIRDVLTEAKDAGKSKRTLVHVRRVLNLIFETLWRDEAISENPVARVRVPAMAQDKRERAVLTDEELALYLGWEHPDGRHKMAVLERQTMACLSRMFGVHEAGRLPLVAALVLAGARGRGRLGPAGAGARRPRLARRTRSLPHQHGEDEGAAGSCSPAD